MTSLLLAIALSAAADPKPVELTLEDQFGQQQEPKAYRGKIVVLVYGDRKATDACRSIGESIHVAFHPTAKGLAPKEARQAPVVALPNVPAGKASPEVFVVPVACTGKVPGVVKSMLQGQIKKASPDVPVWLDTTDAMSGTFGLTTGEPNLVVLDAAGFARHIVNGTPDAKKLQAVAQIIQDLRAAAVK
jgi:hypothetical protein